MDGMISKSSSSIQVTSSGGIVKGPICYNSTVILSVTGGPLNDLYINSNVTWTNAASSTGSRTFINSVMVLDGTYSDKVFIGQNNATTLVEIPDSYNVNGVGGSSSLTLDLDDPSIFAAGVLTLPAASYTVNTFGLIGTTNKVITNIVNLPNYQRIIFYNASLGLVTFDFTVTARASYTGTEILGAANFTLESTSGPSDYLAMANILGAATIIETVKPS